MQVILIAAQSLDGYITHHEKPGSAFTSQEDKTYFRAALADFDATIIGAGTFRAEREIFVTPREPRRLQMIVTRNPAAFANDAKPGELEFTNESPRALISSLRSRGVRRTALLGGAQMHSLFLDAGVVDQLWLTLEPRLFGTGTHLLAGRADHRLRLLAHEHLGGDTLLARYSLRP